MTQFEISARAACRRHGLDPEKYWELIADLVCGTNGAFATSSGGICRSTVADYSDRVAKGIARLPSVHAKVPRDFGLLYRLGAGDGNEELGGLLIAEESLAAMGAWLEKHPDGVNPFNNQRGA